MLHILLAKGLASPMQVLGGAWGGFCLLECVAVGVGSRAVSASSSELLCSEPLRICVLWLIIIKASSAGAVTRAERHGTSRRLE
jgi:hypothetical protein